MNPLVLSVSLELKGDSEESMPRSFGLILRSSTPLDVGTDLVFASLVSRRRSRLVGSAWWCALDGFRSVSW